MLRAILMKCRCCRWSCWWCCCSGAQRSCAQKQSRLKTNCMIILELSRCVCTLRTGTHAPSWNETQPPFWPHYCSADFLLHSITCRDHGCSPGQSFKQCQTCRCGFSLISATSCRSICQFHHKTTRNSICNPIVSHRHALTNKTQIQFPFNSQYWLVRDHIPQTSFRYLTTLCEAGIYPQWPPHPLAGERTLDDHLHNATLWPCVRVWDMYM